MGLTNTASKLIILSNWLHNPWPQVIWDFAILTTLTGGNKMQTIKLIFAH
jgi:hypothetical protein